MATKKKAPVKEVVAEIAPEPAPVVVEPVVSESVAEKPAAVKPQEKAEAAYQVVLEASQAVVAAAAAFEVALAEVKAADPNGGAPDNVLQHNLRGVRALESANRSTLAMVQSGQI